MSKKVKLYRKDGCPYCDMAKNLLASKDVELEVLDIADMSEGQIAVMFEECKDYKSFPRILVDGKFIGGYDELLEMAKQGGV